MMTQAPPEFVRWFRHSSPYINAHRGKTFVVLFGGEAVAAPDFHNLIHDIALLNSLGVRMVLVHGARPQIEQLLARENTETQIVDGVRITTAEALGAVRQAVGSVRTEIEAQLSMGLANSPMAGARIRVSSGNFVTARPVGIRDGTDYCHTGEVRRIDIKAINVSLDAGAIVLISSIGYSPTGEMFNVSAENVATATATSLRADKLLYLAEDPGPCDAEGKLIRQLTPPEAEQLLANRDNLSAATALHLQQALVACRQGVTRVHLLHRSVDGVLLRELFTRDGTGTLLSADQYEGVRAATIDDVGGILELISPLENEGILVRRSRERLETEIGHFVVLERDGGILGCSALYPFTDDRFGELACVAVDPAYQREGRAEILLAYVERQARRRGLAQIFVLTTRTAHWFRERGFEPAELSDLPVSKQSLYNYQRNSRVFIKNFD